MLGSRLLSYWAWPRIGFLSLGKFAIRFPSARGTGF